MNKLSVQKFLKRQETIISVFTLLVFFAFCMLSQNFGTDSNFQLILQQVAVNGICVVGVGVVVILGGIDLSAGAVLALSGVVGGMFIKQGMPVLVAILASIGIGMLCGAFNALLITQLSLPPIITTLATNYLFRGVAIIITGGSWVNNFPREFTKYGTGRIFGTSNVFWMFLIILAIVSYMMKYMNIGRKIYAVGTNNDAADKSGISCTKVKFFGYTLCGGIIGFAGIMYAAQIGAVASTSTGLTLGTQVLAAALAGGISIAGGRGTLFGASVGILMIGIIKNGLILTKVSEFWIDAITGAIILLALALNVLNSREKRREEA